MSKTQVPFASTSHYIFRKPLAPTLLKCRRNLATPVEDSSSNPLGHLVTPTEWQPKKNKMIWSPQAGLVPPADPVELGSTIRARYGEHYQDTLATDLLYLTYNHSHALDPPPDPFRPDWDPLNPYTKGRKPMALPGKNKRLIPKAHPMEVPQDLIHLTSITLNILDPRITKSRSSLVPVLSGLSALTGKRIQSPGETKSRQGIEDGVQVTYTSQSARSYGARVGLPIGAKVKLKHEDMYSFLETLVELVLPRVRNFKGFALPESSKTKNFFDGSVTLTLPLECFTLFPSIEPIQHQYPSMPFIKMTATSNVKGEGAQNAVRSLLSGFRIPVSTFFHNL